MSLTNSLPTWIWVTCIVLWSLTIVLLVFFRIARKRALGRKEPPTQQPAFQWPSTPNFNNQMHHELLSQQIDTVFNALSSLIEAERIKLKSLLGGSLTGNELAIEPSPIESSPQKFQPPPVDQQDMSRMVEQLSRQGLNREQIACQLGLSQNEVALSLKMLANQTGQQSVRLNAVA